VRTRRCFGLVFCIEDGIAAVGSFSLLGRDRGM
jgi:hypothetical protein